MSLAPHAVFDQPASVPLWARAAKVRVFGVPVVPLTLRDVLTAVDQMVASGRPHFAITANLNYAMLTARDPRLEQVNEDAALIVADGMPLVWAARRQGFPLPERVAGSDLLPTLCEHAAQKGYRVFLLGGAPGVAERAAQRLTEANPGLVIAGVASPPFRPMTESETAELIASIRQTQPDILFIAFTQGKSELWLHQHYRRLGIPAMFPLGASIDFAAGRVRRAPAWVGRVGLEWAFRLALEPRRLTGRYLRNAWFLAQCLVRELGPRRSSGPAAPHVSTDA